MCLTLQHMCMRTTHARSAHRNSTKRFFRRSRTILHLHGRESTSRSSMSLSSLPAHHRSHSSATFRSTSATHTSASWRTSSVRTLTSSDARCRFSSDRNKTQTASSSGAVLFCLSPMMTWGASRHSRLSPLRHSRPDRESFSGTACSSPAKLLGVYLLSSHHDRPIRPHTVR